MNRSRRAYRAIKSGAAGFNVLIYSWGCSPMLHSEYTVGTHQVILDGYVSSSSAAASAHVNGSTLIDTGTAITCDGLSLNVKDDQLTVDGKPYAVLQPNDRVRVREHKVYVNEQLPSK